MKAPGISAAAGLTPEFAGEWSYRLSYIPPMGTERRLRTAPDRPLARERRHHRAGLSSESMPATAARRTCSITSTYPVVTEIEL